MEQAASIGVFGALKKMTDTFHGLLPVLILISLIAGVWIYFFVVARHSPALIDWKEGLRGILRFDVMFWPLLGRILYLSISIFLLLSGIITMVSVNLIGGLVGTALLLIFVRILFEMMLVLFSMHERLVRQDIWMAKMRADDSTSADQLASASRLQEKEQKSDPALSVNPESESGKIL